MTYDRLTVDDLERPVLAELFRQCMPHDLNRFARTSREFGLEGLAALMSENDVADRALRAEEMFSEIGHPESQEATRIAVMLCLMAHLPAHATEIPELTIGDNIYNTVRTGELGQMRPSPASLLQEGGTDQLTIRGKPMHQVCTEQDVERICDAARRAARVIAGRIHPVRQSLGQAIFPMPTRSGVNTDLDSSMYPFDHGQMADRMGTCAALDALLVEAEADQELQRILGAHGLSADDWIAIAQAAGDGETLIKACRSADMPQLSLGVRINDRLPGFLHDPTAGWHEKPEVRAEWRDRLLAQVAAQREDPSENLEDMTP